jgi:L-ascorbate metabolism protein UlaG (beta-lactamase superfamily)
MLVIYILLPVAAVALTFILIGYSISAPRYKGPVSDHFDGKQFINPSGAKANGLREVLKWMRERKRGPWMEQLENTFGEKPAERIENGLRITFVNHTTFLIQVDRMNILTDPVWSKRTSPFSWIGPKRMRPPGIRFEDLPKIDLVLLSHNHYDHLDIDTVKRLVKVFNPQFIVSLGVGAFLRQHGIHAYHELDWWQEIAIPKGLSVQALPAQHFSGRGMLDRDATLWCGYLLKGTNGNIYFAGDTGYNAYTFKEIGERCAPIRAALIPIGAYKPVWFMSPIHCSPEEAVQIHQEVKSSLTIASHFGTFPLADEGAEEPVRDLNAALAKLPKPHQPFLTLQEGKGIDIA